jgi:poly-gamma-glutamate capsule biosynthesis protein CapA/YwtB (metallophosphatase superfamily)
MNLTMLHLRVKIRLDSLILSVNFANFFMTTNKLKKVFYKKPNEKFKFIFTGDTSFGENYQEKIKQNGGTSILERFGYEYGLEKLKPIMKDADFVVMNLETPITDCKKSPFEEQKDYLHWAEKEKTLKTLIDHNVSLVSLANNHIFDYGTIGYDQTLAALEEYELPAIGAGNDINQAIQPFTCEINFENTKITVAIIAAFEDLSSYRSKYKVYATPEKSGLMPLDIDKIADQVRKIKTLDPNTFLILFPHWGSNYQWCNQTQRSLSDSLFSCGIDLIIGHGAHMMQEFERRKTNLVLYSIGNFMFHSPGRYKIMEAPPYSSVASLEIQITNNLPDIQLKLYPIVSDNKLTNYQPRFVNKEELDDLNKVLLQKKIMSDSESFLKEKQDKFGYYFQIPALQTNPTEAEFGKTSTKQKWIGMLYHDHHDTKIKNGEFNIILHRASVLAPELAKHNYKLICYSPINVNTDEKTVTGYVLEGNEFKSIFIPIPKVNYDFYIGPDKLNSYYDFMLWALPKGYKIYPTKPIRRVAGDKMLTAEVLSEFDSSITPYTEIFDCSIDQIQRYLSKHPVTFIKPRYGSMGNKILVVKFENNSFTVEYYINRQKELASLSTLPECISHIKKLVNNENYIIQEAIDVVRCKESVFDVRALVFNTGEEWCFLSEIRISEKSSEISNNAGTDITSEFLEKIFSKEKAAMIVEKIKTITINFTIFLNKKYNETINELAFDVIIDKSDNIYFAEINVKPGLAGLTKYGNFFDMTDYEKNFYENLSIKHGYFLAKSLIYQSDS